MPRKSKIPVDESSRRVTRSMTGKVPSKQPPQEERSETRRSRKHENLDDLPTRRSKRINMKKEQVNYEESSSDDDLLPKRRRVRGWTPPKRTSKRATKRTSKASELDDQRTCTKKPKLTARDIEFIEILDDEPPPLSPQPPIATLMKIKKDEINKYEKLRTEQAAQISTIGEIKVDHKNETPASSKRGNRQRKKQDDFEELAGNRKRRANERKKKVKSKKPKPPDQKETSSEGEELETLLAWACPTINEKEKNRESSKVPQIQPRIDKSATTEGQKVQETLMDSKKQPRREHLPISRTPTKVLDLPVMRPGDSQIQRRVDKSPVKILPKDHGKLEGECPKSLEFEREDGQDTISKSSLYKTLMTTVRNSYFNLSIILTAENEKLFRKVLYQLKKDGAVWRESPIETLAGFVQTDPEEKKQTRDQEVQVQETETEKVDQETQYDSTVVVDQESQTIPKDFCHVDKDTQTDCTEVILLDEYVQTDSKPLEEHATQTYSTAIRLADKATEYDTITLVDRATQYDKVNLVKQDTQTDCQQEDEQSQTDITIEIDADVRVVPKVVCTDQGLQAEVERLTQTTQTDPPIEKKKPIPPVLVESSTQTSPIAIRQGVTLSTQTQRVETEQAVQEQRETPGTGSQKVINQKAQIPKKRSKAKSLRMDRATRLEIILDDYKRRLFEQQRHWIKVEKHKYIENGETYVRYSETVDTTRPMFPELLNQRRTELLMSFKRSYAGNWLRKRTKNNSARSNASLKLQTIPNILHASAKSPITTIQPSSSSSESFDEPDNRKVTSKLEPIADKLKKPCITMSCLNKEQISVVEDLTKNGLVSYSRTLTSGVTHLVVNVDGNNSIKFHTLKYLKAVAAGIWILRFDWALYSSRRNRLISEEGYEVRSDTGVDGPRRSRLDKDGPRILSNFKFYAPHQFQLLSKKDAKELIQLLGGTVVDSLKSMENRTCKQICLIVAEDRSPDAITIYERWVRQYGIITVDIEWLIRTTSEYNPANLRPHLLVKEQSLSGEVIMYYPKQLFYKIHK